MDIDNYHYLKLPAAIIHLLSYFCLNESRKLQCAEYNRNFTLRRFLCKVDIV